MAGSTLYTLLVKLGFDIGSLKSGSKDAQVELNAISQAAKLATANASPAAAALTNLSRAAQSVAGTTGSTAVLRNMSGAMNDVLIATKGSGAAMNAVASGAQRIGQAVGSGTVLNKYATSISDVTTATKGSVAAITDFVKGANQTLIATNGSAAGLNRYMTATVAAAQGAGSAADAVKAVHMAARGSVPSLAAAAGAAQAAGAGAAGAGGAAAAAAPKVAAVGKAASAAAASLNMAAAAAQKAAPAIAHVGDAAEMSGRKAGFLQRTLSMAFAFGGGVAVTTAIGFIGNAVLGMNSRLQQAHIAFETLLGDASAADAFIQQMKDFANVTPFSFQAVEESTQRLMAMGFTAEQTLPTLRAVGDAVAGLGGNSEKLDRVTIALGQMMTAGRVNAQDMRQLTEAGIPAWAMLADAIGKTVGETRKMAENGLISSATAIPAILEGMDAKFGGLMAKQARTAQGAFSTIRDAALLTISGAVEPLFNALTVGLAALADFFIAGGGKYFVPLIHAMGVAIAVFLIPRIIGLIGTIGALKVELFSVAIPLLPLIALVYAFGIAWQENFGGIRTVFGPVIKGVLDLAGAMLNLAVSSGLVVPIVTVLASILTVKLVAGLIASSIALIGVAVTSGIAGVGLTGVAASATAASVATKSLLGPFAGLVALVGGVLVAAIGLIVGAFALLLLNWDRVGQGLRVLELTFLGTVETLLRGAAMLPFVGDGFKGMADGVHEAQEGIKRDMAAMEAQIAAAEQKSKMEAPDLSHLSATDQFDKLLESFKTGTSNVATETRKLVDIFGATMQGVVEAAKTAGGTAMVEMAKSIRDKQDAPLNALKTLYEMIRNQFTTQSEIARLYGMLTSTELAAGLASGDPAIRAQMEATKKLITERLDEVTEGAYTAGTNAATAYARAWADVQSNNTLASMGYALNQTVEEKVAAQKSAWDKLKPSASAVANEMKKVNDQLTAAARSEGLSRLNSAFSAISSSAKRFFDSMHQDNLKLIDDAVKHKNAILDAKAALNQAPVTAAQKALDFQRRQIEEWRMRQAVAKASTPEEQRDAILALQDFLAQSHIDDMQAQVDSANDKIDQQKEANAAVAEAQRIAEDARYQYQVESFERELELLRRYLEKHPGEWQNINQQILTLLDSYGVNYQAAGARLGEFFVIGLREQIDEAVAGMLRMNDLLPATGAGTGSPNFGPNYMGPRLQSPTVSSLGVPGTNTRPIIVQVGDQLLAEITDRQMSEQTGIYANRTHVTVGSGR